MATQREQFLRHLAQTSPAPLGLEIEKAEGVYLYDISGKKYLDLISGISVSNLGHRHPAVVKAIKEQVDKYLYLMVYGEYIQSPQVKLAAKLASILPEPLKCTYLTNSGAEAIEGALKLAKRFTGRTEIIAFRNSYHGSTHAALSITGSESLKNAYRPLLPDIRFLDYGDEEQLEQISNRTAAVVVEPVQAEAGVKVPSVEFLRKLEQKCKESGVLLIVDEIQTGLGRTGKLFAFEHSGILPDILCLAKAFGGGMPIGAFISRGEVMETLTHNPVLGHITTFGGHPVSAAAALANLTVLIESNLIEDVQRKSAIFKSKLKHSMIKDFRSSGLLISLEFEDFDTCKQIIDYAIENGVITDWFLFASNCLRIAPPLIITDAEIEWACNVILKGIEFVNESKI